MDLKEQQSDLKRGRGHYRARVSIDSTTVQVEGDFDLDVIGASEDLLNHMIDVAIRSQIEVVVLQAELYPEPAEEAAKG